MNAPPGGSWRGGKKSSAAKSQSSSAAAQTQRGWKSSKKTAGHGRKKNSKKLSQFVAFSCFLLVLVAIAIWIFWPNYQLHTHFVILDPLQGNDRFPYSAKVNFPESNVEGARHFTVGKHSRTESQTLDFFTEQEISSEESNIKSAKVCVIYLRAATIPGSDQSHLVLSKNSTTDPQVENQHEPLSKLKEKIAQLPEEQRIVLIVDLNSIAQDWRAGLFGDSPHDQIIKWTKEFPNLITILSCGVGEKSWPSGLPGHGGTVFEMVLNDAFSLKADQPTEGRNTGDGSLSVKELYEYLARETNAWVLANRSEQGQHVEIYPPLAEIESDQTGQPVILMKALPKPTPFQPDMNGAKDLVNQFGELWTNAEGSEDGNSELTVPLLHTAATAQLKAAEASLMQGRLDVAKTLLDLSSENFVNAEHMSKDRNDQIELSLSSRDHLIEHSEINEWLSSNRLVARQIEDAPTEPAHQILSNSIDTYSFGSTTIEKPQQSNIDLIVNARKRMEKSTALMFHDSFQFRPLLQKMQRQLLEVEDLVFVNSEYLPVDYRIPNADKFFRTFEEQSNLIEEYVLLKLEVERFQLQLLTELPELVEWAAGFHDTRYTSKILQGLETGQATTPPNRATPTEQLQFEIVNALQNAEKLLESYFKQRSQQFEETAELGDALSKLKSQYQLLSTIWNQIDEMHPQVQSSIPSPMTHKWSQSFNATKLPVFNQVIRSAFLKGGMLPWSEGDPETAEPDQLNAAPNSDIQFQKYRDDLVWNITWRLRLQDLMRLTNTADADVVEKQTQAMWDALELLRDAANTQEVHRQIHNLGTLIRNDWESRRNQMTTALKYSGSNLHEYSNRLLKSDLAARFFRADDVDLWRTRRDVQLAFERVNQVQYCLFLADHAILSQWVNPTDRPVENANKWFYQKTDAWLKLAEQLITRDASLSVAQDDISNRRNELANIDKWTEQVQLQLPSLQRFEEQQQIKFAVNINFQGSLPPAALTSLTFIGTEAKQGSRNVIQLSKNAIPIKIDENGSSTELAVKRLYVPKPENCSSVSLRPQMFYRGRTIQKTPIVINPCPSSQRTWQYLPGRQTAEINVIGDDNRPVIFVLDWSASMNEQDSDGISKQRHIAATNAVRLLIEQMPDTKRVGLVIFGHANRDIDEAPNVSFEQNFGDLIEIKNRSADQDVDIIHPIGLLKEDRATIEEKLDLLKKVTPYATTPLGMAMTIAANELDKKSDSGGIIVAITDGAPTDLGDAEKQFPDNSGAAERRQKILNRTFDDLERALRPDEISAIIFALDFDDEDLTTLNCLFENGGNQGPCSFMKSRKSLQVPVVRASGESDRDGGTLREVIDAQIEPRPFQVFLANGERVAEEPLKDATILVKQNETYRIQFGDIDLKDIKLAAGDVISLEMNWSKNRFDINRKFASQKSKSVATATANKTDVPDILRINKVKKPNINTDPDFYENIEIDVMLDHNRDYRPVQKPEEIWFELTAIGDSTFRPDAVNQEYTSKFGAPGWSLHISPWPKTRELSINAFWKMKRTVPDQIVSSERLAPAASRDEALLLGGDSQPIPAFKIWHKERHENDRKVYEVRIEPEDDINVNVLSDLTVDIGETSILSENHTFEPDATTHLKTIVDSGVIVHSFAYTTDDVDLAKKVIAITSRTSREKGALHLREPILVFE